MITRKQYEWARRKVEKLRPLVNDDTPPDAPEGIELELLSGLVADYEDACYPTDKPSLPKLNEEDFRVNEAIQSICGSVKTPSLNEGIPNRVTPQELKDAADCYEEADNRWKDLFKKSDLAAKEDAGDHLYCLVRGLLKNGGFSSSPDSVTNSQGEDTPAPNDNEQ